MNPSSRPRFAEFSDHFPIAKLDQVGILGLKGKGS